MTLNGIGQAAGRGALTVAGYGAAGAAGLGIAHKVSNQGDYQDNRKWTVGAALGFGVVTAGAAVLSVKGSSMARQALLGAEHVGTELANSSRAVALASKGKAAASEALTEVEAGFHAAQKAQLRTVETGLKLKDASSLAVAGGASGLLLTSVRLDPGILHVKVDGTIEVKEASRVEKLREEAGDLGDLGGDVAGGVGDVAGDVAGGIGGFLGDVLRFATPLGD